MLDYADKIEKLRRPTQQELLAADLEIKRKAAMAWLGDKYLVAKPKQPPALMVAGRGGAAIERVM